MHRNEMHLLAKNILDIHRGRSVLGELKLKDICHEEKRKRSDEPCVTDRSYDLLFREIGYISRKKRRALVESIVRAIHRKGRSIYMKRSIYLSANLFRHFISLPTSDHQP